MCCFVYINLNCNSYFRTEDVDCKNKVYFLGFFKIKVERLNCDYSGSGKLFMFFSMICHFYKFSSELNLIRRAGAKYYFLYLGKKLFFISFRRV